MSRPPDIARRNQLIEQAIHYGAQHGIASLSLRPLAAALGTSSRMLVHYFGTKENLLTQLIDATLPDVPALLAAHREAGHTAAEAATRLWHQLTCGGDHEDRARLLFEVMALALTQPTRYGALAARATEGWIAPLAAAIQQAGYDETEAAARATLLVSGLRGLAVDRYLTGDRPRTDRAAALLIETTVQ